MSQDARETKAYPESALNKLALLVIACEQALLFGQTKRASRERASEGPRKGKIVAPRIKTAHRQLRTVFKASDC